MAVIRSPQGELVFFGAPSRRQRLARRRRLTILALAGLAFAGWAFGELSGGRNPSVTGVEAVRAFPFE